MTSEADFDSCFQREILVNSSGKQAQKNLPALGWGRGEHLQTRPQNDDGVLAARLGRGGVLTFLYTETMLHFHTLLLVAVGTDRLKERKTFLFKIPGLDMETSRTEGFSPVTDVISRLCAI